MNRFLLYPRRYKALLPFVVLIAFLTGCKCVKPQVSNSANIILTDPGLSDEVIQQQVTQNTSIPPTAVKIKRCPCDPALINIALPNDWQFEGQEGRVTTTPTGGGQSGGTDINLGISAINRMLTPLEESQLFSRRRLDSLRQYKVDSSQLIPIGNPPKDVAKAISIAVFDSGLDPTFLPGVSWQRSTTLCTTSASTVPASSIQGWDFVDGPITSSTGDAYQPIEHGSKVAYFVARQFGASSVPVRIVPMKVLGADNKGDLFNVLCAMETARKNNVEVFNMSLGYYGDRDPVFAQYMKRAVDQGIWIVTAAGNQPTPSEERNLSKREKKSSFYPAYFSKESAFDRVIAVTTMNGSTVCDGQNFDENFVVGVKDDAICRFKFLKPGIPSVFTTGVIGTSYATPIVAGWV